MATPEDKAREHIDQALEQSGWKVQDTKSANVYAGRGVALRNFPITVRHGFETQTGKHGQEACAIDFACLKNNRTFAAVDRRLSVIDELEVTIEANLIRADHLRQSILGKAFSGRLGKDAFGKRIAGD